MTEKQLLELIDYLVPPPLTRDEIKTLLEKHGYPMDNSRVIDDLVKIIRILESDGYGITLKGENDVLYMNRLAHFIESYNQSKKTH